MSFFQSWFGVYVGGGMVLVQEAVYVLVRVCVIICRHSEFPSMNWGYIAFISAGSPSRPLRVGVVQGRDCVIHDGGHIVLPLEWWEEAWSHARDWDPRFCYWYGDMESIADEACLSGQFDLAVIVLSLYTWLLLEYSCVNLAAPRVSSDVLSALRVEVTFWEGLWERWGSAMQTGPWDFV